MQNGSPFVSSTMCYYDTDCYDQLKSLNCSYKFQISPVAYLTKHHSEQKYDISVRNVALWDMGRLHCGICELWPHADN